MLNRNFLSGVSGLKLAGKINGMNDAQFTNYVRELNSFIDEFPVYENKLRAASDTKNYTVLKKELNEVCVILSGIFADDIAREYAAKIEKISAADHDNTETLVENLIQRGSALSIDIQMAIHGNKESVKPQKAAWSSARPTVLAVDNAVMFLNTLKKQLQDEPIDLQCTASCAEALKFCSERKPDMVLLDVEMPEMDGYELAKRIKKNGLKAPIIFITANSDREYVDKAIAVGAVGLLVKPLRINQLLEKLKEHL